MIGTILSYLPTWSYWVIAAVALAATIPYWTPIWLALPRWAKGLILLAGGVFTAWHAGRRQQRIADEQAQREANARAIQRREEVHRDVSKLSDSDIDRKLRGSGWMRD